MGELDRRLDRVTEALVREKTERQFAATVPVLQELGIPTEEWPELRRRAEKSVRRRLADGPLTAEQLEARIAEEAQPWD